MKDTTSEILLKEEVAEWKWIVRWLIRGGLIMGGLGIVAPFGAVLVVGSCVPEQGLIVAPYVERALIASVTHKTLDDPDSGEEGYRPPKPFVVPWYKGVE